MYGVYCLISETNPDKIYVGMTNNIRRRLQEHNSGANGARTTQANRPWKVAVHITGLSQKEAAQLEYAIKNCRVKMAGLTGFKMKINKLMLRERWTEKSTPTEDIAKRLRIRTYE